MLGQIVVIYQLEDTLAYCLPHQRGFLALLVWPPPLVLLGVWGGRPGLFQFKFVMA